MEYTFKLKEVQGYRIYTIITKKEEAINVISRLTDTFWTPTKVQEIIDGVNQSKSEGKRYEWANEDIHLVALSNGVYFFDLMARRADKNHPTGQDLDLRHDEFISFLHDFKKFVEENQ